jgi:phospholipid transport system substrate-binding protein
MKRDVRAEVSMDVIRFYRKIFFFVLILAVASPVWAGVPTEKIRETTEKILSIVTDPDLKGAEKEGERRRLIREAVDERFDWKEMSQRALARHWRKLNDVQKQEFITLFGELLERTYLNRVEDYSGEQVTYMNEVIEGEYALVEVKILTTKGTEIPVNYKLRKKGGDWRVYDIAIEGVSLVNNYRVQFNDIITKSSYEELVKKLQEKVAEK